MFKIQSMMSFQVSGYTLTFTIKNRTEYGSAYVKEAPIDSVYISILDVP